MSDNAARYLGFAFASAELLFELDGAGRIVIAVGAAQKLVGAKQDELAGQPWQRLFAPDSRAVVAAIIDSLAAADRRGPVRVELAASPERKLRRFVSFSACRLPQLAPNISCAISLGAGLSSTAEPKGSFGLHDHDGLLCAADSLMQAPPGLDLDVALVEFQGLSAAARAMAPAEARSSLNKIAAAMRAESYAGQTAAQLTDERFAVVRPRAEPPDQLLKRLSAAAERAGLPVAATGASMDLNPTPTGQGMRALKFALDTFIKDGASAAGSAFNRILAQTNAQAAAFRQSVTERKFRLVYQPIVHLASGEAHHFEVLTRFEGEDVSPASAIKLAEELDLIHELDMAVGDLTMRRLAAPGNSRLKLAINMSARSLVRPGFLQQFLTKTQGFTGLAGRLLVEITESAAIDDLEAANRHIQALRGRGFPVYLDDFGAGAAALSYLRALQVDTVKIDGQYVRDIESAGRADAVVRHLVELCAELEIGTVAEMVETQRAADILSQLGVDYAQGYLFGKPALEPVFNKPLAAAVRRVGAVETWG